MPRDLALATQRTHASPHQTLVTELEAAAIVEQWCLILHAASFGSQEWREDTRAAVKVRWTILAAEAAHPQQVNNPFSSPNANASGQQPIDKSIIL